jgi:hypothetical protein
MNAELMKQIAEERGYRACERSPRGSLNRFVEIIAPDGGVMGSAAGKQEIVEIVEMAWQDALGRLPSWAATDHDNGDMPIFP